MKTALTVWGNRVSPVFDSAHMLLIVEIKNAKIIDRRYESFNPEKPSYLIEMLVDQDIEVLICGAISETPANIIEAGSIELIPFITGNADEVLESYAKGVQITPLFLMPGCSRKHHRQCGKSKIPKRRRNRITRQRKSR